MPDYVSKHGKHDQFKHGHAIKIHCISLSSLSGISHKTVLLCNNGFKTNQL